jgi:hypothetical protein
MDHGWDDGWMRLGRWRAGVPRHIRLLVGTEAALLTYGGVVHVVQVLTDGWPPYAWAPGWLAIYFVCLTLFDPLAAALLLAGRPFGLYLGAAILVTDAAANAYADYGLTGTTLTNRIAQGAISILALAALLALPRIRPWMRGSRAVRGIPDDFRDRRESYCVEPQPGNPLRGGREWVWEAS